MKKTAIVVAGLMVIAGILALVLASSPAAAAPKPGGCTATCQYLYDKCVRTTRDQTYCISQYCDCMCKCGPSSCIC